MQFLKLKNCTVSNYHSVIIQFILQSYGLLQIITYWIEFFLNIDVNKEKFPSASTEDDISCVSIQINK